MKDIRDRLADYTVHAMVTPETVTPLTERVHALLKSAEGVVLIRRYLGESRDELEIQTGLHADAWNFKSNWHSVWYFNPGVTAFGLSADSGGDESALWAIYHDENRANKEMTMLMIQGRSFEDYAARIVKRNWNQFGVCVETTLVPWIDRKN